MREGRKEGQSLSSPSDIKPLSTEVKDFTSSISTNRIPLFVGLQYHNLFLILTVN